MKKIISDIILTAMLLSGIPAGAAADDGRIVELPVIMYHEVKDRGLGKNAISPGEFESDLKYLREEGYTAVGMAEVIGYVYSGTPLPEKPVVLSFDDGYLNTYQHVFPLLEQYDMKIVMALIAQTTEEFSHYPEGGRYAHMRWEHVNEMLDAGRAEIQNHTYNLHKNGSRTGCAQRRGEPLEQYERVLREDAAKGQQMIFANTGAWPDAYVYPYGRYSENTTNILKKLGFTATLSCDYGINLLAVGDTQALLDMRRICRAHGKPVSQLLKDAEKWLALRRAERS